MKYLELKIPPVGLALLTALLMWLVHQAAPFPGLKFSLPREISAMLLVAGIAAALAGVVSFRRARTTVNPGQPDSATSLVCSGIFRVTRNPMYLGLLLALLAWALHLGNMLSLLLAPAFVLYMNRFQVRPEERALANLFGQEYQRYLQRVRRWL
jgi:protein-S-isoprenylcysteine O-methyltransferase Ste14